MVNIHDVFKEDDVNGQIIGGAYFVGQLYYQNRPQGGQLYAVTEESLLQKAKELKAQYMREDREYDLRIFRNENDWQFKIFN